MPPATESVVTFSLVPAALLGRRRLSASDDIEGAVATLLSVEPSSVTAHDRGFGVYQMLVIATDDNAADNLVDVVAAPSFATDVSAASGVSFAVRDVQVEMIAPQPHSVLYAPLHPPPSWRRRQAHRRRRPQRTTRRTSRPCT